MSDATPFKTPEEKSNYRDTVALQALNGIISSMGDGAYTLPDAAQAADQAYNYADAMLRRREA